MDEEESQEQLVNMKVSQGNSLRKWSVLTDEGGSAEEGGSESEDSVGCREEIEDEGEGGAMKAAGGTAAGVPAPLQDLSSDDEAEKCPICLHSFQEQPVATPIGCQHHFCLDCILEWSKNVNSCPVDRIAFSAIHLREGYGGKVQKTIPVQEPVKVEEEELSVDFDQTSCEVCGRSDREDRLLLCDGCDAGYHIECLTPPLDAVPVEEWFCPECMSNNPHTDSAEEVSDAEVAALLTDAVPTTSRLRTSAAGRTRSIARTRQSERVRATVNRNRITQARAIQHVPRCLIQSTWLDETINAVLNSSACARRGRTGEKHRKAQRKKTSTETSGSSSIKDRTAGKDMKLHRGHLKGSKPGQKQGGKKDPTPHSFIPKSSTSGKPKQSPPARPLGGHPKIRPASLSVFGDPSDLDPSDDESSEGGSVPPIDPSRRGLSHSALRSHQPVARPIQHGLPRCSLTMSEGDMMEDSAPVPDLLGSILSGQSLLLMDSSTMVINRDGSLKLGKPACTSSAKTEISSQASTHETEVHAGMASGSGLTGDAQPSQSHLHIPSSSHSFPGSSSPPAKPTSPLTSLVVPGNTNICSPILVPERGPNICTPHPLNPFGLNHRSWSKTSTISPSLPSRHCLSDWASRGKWLETGMGKESVKKDPPKPVWLDVSRLPRIPKIRKGADSLTSLQGPPWREQGSTEANRKKKQGRANTSCTSSSSWTSTSNPSCSSPGSFCISDPWQTMCPTSPERHITSLGSAENQLIEKQSWNTQDPSHPMSSHLPGSDGVPEGDILGRHAKGVMLKERPVVPSISECNYDGADCQTGPETFVFIKEKNKYSENIKMERLCNQNLPQEGQPTIYNSRTDVANADTEKCSSHNVLSSQKQDSTLHSERIKSKPKDQHSWSRSSSWSATRGRTNPDARGKLKECNLMTGGPDGRQCGTEAKRKSREVTACCSQSRERKIVQSSSESSLSPEGPRRRRRCSISHSPHRSSHYCNEDPSRSGRPSERGHERHNRKGSESRGFSQPRFRSRSRSRSRERRKDWVKSLSLHKLKDRSRSKDGKRARSRSLSRERKNDKNKSHSTHSTESSRRTNQPSSASPSDMENNHKPVSLKDPDLTDQNEMQQNRPFSPGDVSKPHKSKTDKNASLSRVKDKISASAFLSKKGQRREEKKEKQKKEDEEIKPDLEKMADTEQIWVQSHIKSFCKSPVPSSVETDSESLSIEKKEHFFEMMDSAGSVSSQKEEKGTKESLPAPEQKKWPTKISAEYTEHLNVDYTPNSLDDKRPDEAEVTGPSCDMGKTVFTDTPEALGGTEASMITGTSETIGDMGSIVSTNSPETFCDLDNTMSTDTPETLIDTESRVITGTPETVGGTKKTAIPDTPETSIDMENTVITDTHETDGDTENIVITDTPETLGDTKNTVITDTLETSLDTKNPVMTDTHETVGDIESAVISDAPKTVDGMRDAKTMGRTVVKQVGHTALKSAVIMTFSTISRRPVKRVTWSLQEFDDAPPVQPTMSPSNTLRQSGKDGHKLPASPSQGTDNWHLRERAVAEVKLAIRPFFQKKEITKDEYKEIWGKAVQKICCSKSGEISPERVAILVKAYVEKYKFLKKQQKDRQSLEEETI